MEPLTPSMTPAERAFAIEYLRRSPYRRLRMSMIESLARRVSSRQDSRPEVRHTPERGGT
jgi:hypothetical protein